MKKVLVLEDDLWLADSLKQMLERDFSVKKCALPSECLDIIESWRPDVLLADVFLGSNNAFTLLNEIQSYDDIRNLPVVILSSHASKINAEDVRNFGVKLVLDKAKITPATLRENLKGIRVTPNNRSEDNG